MSGPDKVYAPNVTIQSAIPQNEDVESNPLTDSLSICEEYLIDVCMETFNSMSDVMKEKSTLTNIECDIQYVIIGRYYPDITSADFISSDLPDGNPLAIAVQQLRQNGFQVIVGKWNVPGFPTAILFDIDSSCEMLNQCKEMLQRTVTGLVIRDDDILANNAILFGFVVAQFICLLRASTITNVETEPVQVHFHEWSSAVALLYLKQTNIATVFTSYESMYHCGDPLEMDWIQHRSCIERAASIAAHVKSFGGALTTDEVKELYRQAKQALYRQTTTWYFDVTYTVDTSISDTIISHAAKSELEHYQGRHVVMVPCHKNWEGHLSSFEIPPGPVFDAVETMKLLGYNIKLGRVNSIPGQPIAFLFDTESAKDQVFERVKYDLIAKCDPIYLESLFTDEHCFEYLVSLYFSLLNKYWLYHEIKTGKKVVKVIRQYLLQNRHKEYPNDVYSGYRYNMGSANEDYDDDFDLRGEAFADDGYFVNPDFEQDAANRPNPYYKNNNEEEYSNDDEDYYYNDDYVPDEDVDFAADNYYYDYNNDDDSLSQEDIEYQFDVPSPNEYGYATDDLVTNYDEE